MLFGGLYGAFAVTRPVQIPPWVVLLVALCVFWGAAFGSEWVLEKLAARAGSQDI